MKNKKFNPFENLKLDKYEQEIDNAIERGKVKSVGNLEAQKEKVARYAAYTLKQRKNKRINIRISERDLNQIQTKAIENGLPYQTLITTILRQYVNGKIKVNL